MHSQENIKRYNQAYKDTYLVAKIMDIMPGIARVIYTKISKCTMMWH